MKFTVTRSIKSQQRLSRKIIAQGKTIAIVPTMGFLHDGHLSLIKAGLKKADVVVTTIFVNPTQFAPNEDFNRYPRDTGGDITKIRSAGGQVAFVPKTDAMYKEDHQTFVEVAELTKDLEGRARPTHFRGVTTIVAKLFNIVQPDVALFGMKDYQQAIVLKRMTADLNWPIKFVIAPTVREKDGLAMSSRNKYLSPALRKEAVALYKSLTHAKKLVRSGTLNTGKIEKDMRQLIKQTAPSGKIDYIAFTEFDTLKPLRKIGKNTIASMALRLGPVRLIDNMKIA